MNQTLDERAGIAVDIDGTLLDFMNPFLKYYNQRFGTAFIEEDVFSFDLWKVFGMKEGEEIPIIKDFYNSQHFKTLQPIPGSHETISGLSKKFQLAIVTARPKEILEETIRSLEKFFPNSFSDFYFANSKFFGNGNQNKSSFCVSNGYKFIIEDAPENAIECAENGIRVLLMNQPWNNGRNNSNLDSHSLIYRVKNWGEILEKLNSKNSLF